MLNNRQLFLNHVAQTSFNPLLEEIDHAEGIYMYTPSGKRIMDMVSGVSVSNVGNRHPNVLKAVEEQIGKYMHLMYYGELVQSPQVKFAKRILDFMPEPLDNVYFVNSGSEATDGALKLAKKFTGRSEIISFHNAYHGSTIGAMSIWGSDKINDAYKPLLPGVKRIRFNEIDDLSQITGQTACVITEAIQSEAGLIIPSKEYIQALRQRCTEKGALLIIDEVQMGFGRTGKMFGFQNFDIVPDIVTMAKGMGGGMPIGAFVANRKVMQSFMNPPLGHITTFGGHPVSAAAGLASLNTIAYEHLHEQAQAKGDYFESLMKKHPKVKRVWGIGLFRGIEMSDDFHILDFMHKCIEHGILMDLFIFADHKFRFTPPLIITNEQIEEAVRLLWETLDDM